MTRKNRTDQELGWLRNVWEELAASELKHGSFAVVEIRATASRARFTVKFKMERPDTDAGLPAWSASTVHHYPNGDATQFLPWLWGRASAFADFCDHSDQALAPQEKHED